MSPIAGQTRLRRHFFGRQAVMGTKVPATRAYPFSGTPDVNLNWTDPDNDTGSLDPTVPPTRTAPDLTAALTDNSLWYNTLPLLFAGIFGGAEAPTGGGLDKHWTWRPASSTADPFDPFSYEFGDDVTTDWFQLGDGTLETVTLSAPEGLGPWTASMTWRFGSASSTGSTDSPADGGVPAALTLDTDAAIVYLKDFGIYISDTFAGLDASQITGALHSLSLTVTQAIDQKRFADRTHTFDVSDFGRGARTIELEATWAKTADIVGTGSEADHWFSDDAVTRYVKIAGESTVIITGSTPYSMSLAMPMRYYTRAEGEVGGNSTVVLNGHAFYEPDDFAGVFEAIVVNTVDEAELGLIGS